MPRRKHLGRLVWAILIAAFSLCCALAIGTPLLVRSHLFNATVEMQAVLEAISGTVLMQGPGNPEPIGLTMSSTAGSNAPRLRDIKAGSTIITDSTSRAVLTFHSGNAGGKSEDVVLGTVQLYSDARIKILENHASRYRISPNPPRITLQLDAGQTRIAVARGDGRPPYFQVYTPHGKAILNEGSYSIRVTRDMSEVVVRFGEATAEAGAQAVVIRSGQRTTFAADGVPQMPMPAAQNLVANGNFVEPLTPAWQVDVFQATADPDPAKAEIVTTSGRKAVFFSRMGKDGVHNEAGISQVINRDVLDFESLVLRMDVNLLHQSLAGGGYLSSEFPVMVRIDYKDTYGIDRFWIHGFYYQNVDAYPIQSDLWGRPIGEAIPQAVWYPFESDNLLKALGDLRPARIHSIRIYASGWNFQSMVSEVGLIAE
jgi:hypothetical protein